MQLIDGRYVYSASDLNDYLECKRLTEQNLLVASGRLEKPKRDDDEQAALIARKGDEHETRHLAKLQADYGTERVAVFGRSENSIAGYQTAAAETLAAMAAGVPILYQATFFDGQFLGRADFLRRVETPSAHWPWSYEVLDTKLALNPKPYFVVQLCNYSEHLARLQGTMPACGYIVLGDGTEQGYWLHDYLAYYRHLKERFVQYAGELERTGETAARTYPLKCEHCKYCLWDDQCTQRRTADDHLSGVAWMRRDQIATFEGAGIATIDALAGAVDEARPTGMAESTFAKLRRQARLQVQGRQRNEHLYEIVEHAPPAGFAVLPQPAPGDVFFDMEGDPVFAPPLGLEYLFGCWMPDDEPRFRAFWGCDRDRGNHRDHEKAAFEAFVDFIVERRRRYPALHVYHYAPYEKTALRRLAQQHCTREEEVDDLLRGEVLVDLYAVVRQTVVISEDGYGLKKIEKFYGQRRSTDVQKGDESVVKFERWLLERNGAILEDIESYNRDDCESTYGLREWLLQRRDEHIAASGTEFAFRPVKDPRDPCHAEFEESCRYCRERRADQLEDERRTDLERRLLRDVLAPRTEQEYALMSDDRRTRFLLANLLPYHRREDRPQWWAYFDRRENVDQLKEHDKESIGELELCRDVEPIEATKKLRIYTYRYPEQQHKLGIGDTPHDPLGETKSAGTIVGLDEEARTLQLRRRESTEEAAAIHALIPMGPIDSRAQRKALRQIAQAYVDGGLHARCPAIEQMLTRKRPIVHGITPGDAIQPAMPDAAAVSRIVNALDGSHLFVQGPPGSGKTTIGASVIADLLQNGKRIGIASTGHKAIHNLLHKVEAEMARRGATFSGLYKHSDGNAGSAFQSELDVPFVESVGQNKRFDAADYQLAGGTAWLFSREEMAGAFDYLFIDEAGQVALADALAMSTCAKNVVLLGDPSQLAQVSHGIHPPHVGDSVLQHLLGDDETVATDRGIFLDRSFRMQPKICRFVSDAVYGGRLQNDPATATHAVLVDGERLAGLRYAPIAHEGNSSRSAEEADFIVGEIARLRQGSVVDSRDGNRPRPLRDADVLVITPYNAQRRLIERKLKAAGLAVAVGTVDKFQGREAAVVFYSMASSSGDDAPRDMTFLFERNRFNVAVSRARALSVLVCSPTLLETSCRSPQQMTLVNLLCAFVQAAPEPATDCVDARDRSALA